MKKKLLLGIGAIALVALNVLAFSAMSAFAYQKPIEPIFIGDCYQTVSACGLSHIQYENCTSMKTAHLCRQTNVKCRPCGNEPIIFDPIDGPVVDPFYPYKPLDPIEPVNPIEGPIGPIDPVEPIIIIVSPI